MFYRSAQVPLTFPLSIFWNSTGHRYLTIPRTENIQTKLSSIFSTAMLSSLGCYFCVNLPAISFVAFPFHGEKTFKQNFLLEQVQCLLAGTSVAPGHCTSIPLRTHSDYKADQKFPVFPASKIKHGFPATTFHSYVCNLSTVLYFIKTYGGICIRFNLQNVSWIPEVRYPPPKSIERSPGL